MKLTNVLFTGALLAAATQFASATPITGSIGISGPDTFTSNSITFAPGSPNGAVVVGATSGTMNNFASTYSSTQPVTLTSFSFDSSADGVTLLSITNAANDTLKFVIDSVTSFGTTPSLNSPNEQVTGNGTFTDVDSTGNSIFDPTNGTFTLTTSTNGVTTFTLQTSAVAVTPEPSSLMLLGTGLLGAAGLLVRRRRITV